MRKHDLKEDRFVTATFQLTTYVRERQNTFLAILAALVVAVIIVAVVASSRTRTQQAVGQLSSEAHSLYQMGNYQEAIQRFQSVLDQYGRTQQADMAAFLLADSYFKLGDYEKSIESYQLYVDKYHRDQLLTASSLTGIAVCHEQLNRYAQAGDFYQQAARGYPNLFLAPESLLNAGRCYVLAGQDNDAIAAFQDLIEKYPKSRYVDDARVAMIELRET